MGNILHNCWFTYMYYNMVSLEMLTLLTLLKIAVFPLHLNTQNSYLSMILCTILIYHVGIIIVISGKCDV